MFPQTEAIKNLIAHAVSQLNTITETLSAVQKVMLALAAQLPEYPVVMRMFGVGETLGGRV